MVFHDEEALNTKSSCYRLFL